MAKGNLRPRDTSTEKPAATEKEHKIVSRQEWITAREALLTKEKEFTHAREQLAEERRALPWEKVEKQYVFEGPNGVPRPASEGTRQESGESAGLGASPRSIRESLITILKLDHSCLAAD